MFMKFDLLSGYDPNRFDVQPEHAFNQKICINLKLINTVQQTGHFEERPIEREPDILDAAPPPRGRVAPRAARRRNPQVFIPYEDQFMICLENGNTYTVKGKFDEFCEILCQFREKLESV